MLIVDGEEGVCDVLGSILKTYGADVTAVTSAAEALDEVRAERPYVLICDIGIPKTDGFSLMSQVRALPRTGRDNTGRGSGNWGYRL